MILSDFYAHFSTDFNYMYDIYALGFYCKDVVSLFCICVSVSDMTEFSVELTDLIQLHWKRVTRLIKGELSIRNDQWRDQHVHQSSPKMGVRRGHQLYVGGNDQWIHNSIHLSQRKRDRRIRTNIGRYFEFILLPRSGWHDAF